MPAGLIGVGLTSAERLDLFASYGAGETGPFDASKGTSLAVGNSGVHTKTSSSVSSELSANPSPSRVGNRTGQWSTGRLLRGGNFSRLECRNLGLIGLTPLPLQVPQAGPVRIHAEGLSAASLWIGGKAATGAKRSPLIPAGTPLDCGSLRPQQIPEYAGSTTADGKFVIRKWG